jgi:hypothetical protein
VEITLTDYFQTRLRIRRVPEQVVRSIIENSTERYFDNETLRHIAVGRAEFGRKGARLLMVAYEREGNILTPVTVHDVTRAQVRRRVTQERWVPE